jgi:hypothetical protein
MNHPVGVGPFRGPGVVVFLAALALGTSGCSGGGGGGGANETTQHFELSVAAKAANVPLTNGTSVPFVGTYHAPHVPGPMAFTALKLDAAATLATASLTKTGSRKADPAWGFSSPAATDADVTLFVGADEATVCASGIRYGPFGVTLGGAPPDPLEADQATLSILNRGSAAVCVLVVPHVDATLNVGKVAVDATTCEVPAQDIGGEWTGTYQCINSPCGSDGGPVTLFITQDGHSAHYTDDGGATYDGTVCGGVFRFNGGGTDPGGDYTEGGTFFLNADGGASKSSTWRYVAPDACAGSCSDTLSRVSS